MIIESIALAATLVFSFYSWNQQEKQKNNQLLTQQKDISNKQNAIIEIRKQRIIKKFNPDEMYSFVFIASFAYIGSWFYLPLQYLIVPLLVYQNRFVFVISWRLLQQGKLGVESLLVFSILGAIIKHHLFIAALLSFTIKISNHLTAKSLKDSKNHLKNLFEHAPETVWLIQADGLEVSIPLQKIQKGDILVVNAGEVIPADGIITQGYAGIDQHRLTGESMPIEKGVGEEVFALTLVVSGKIYFKVEQAGQESSAAKITKILDNTTEYKSLTALRSESFSQSLVYPAFIAALLVWPLLGFSAAISIFLVHPKNRLGISSAISLLRYLKLSSENGMLIKDGRSLELLNQVDTIVFDKTGTLTEEEPHIGKIYNFSEYQDTEVLQFAAIAEYKQPHPVAQAILKAAQAQNITEVIPEHSEYALGYGIKVIWNNKTILVGSERFMEMENIIVTKAAKKLQTKAKAEGYGLVMVAVDQQLIGALELLPTIRLEAQKVIHQLKQFKQIKKTYIISGDSEAPTHRLAYELGIDHYFAQTLPQEKASLIAKLQQQGAFVCYIGDGINDAIAMKQAQVSVSLSGASQLATDTAQIILLDQGIQHLPYLFNYAKGFQQHINRQLSTVMGGSIIGLTGIFLAGWGITTIMLLNITSIATTVTYSLLSKPKTGITTPLLPYQIHNKNRLIKKKRKKKRILKQIKSLT